MNRCHVYSGSSHHNVLYLHFSSSCPTAPVATLFAVARGLRIRSIHCTAALHVQPCPIVQSQLPRLLSTRLFKILLKKSTGRVEECVAVRILLQATYLLHRPHRLAFQTILVQN